MEDYTPWAKHVKHPLGKPLLGDFVGDYMNRADVRKALNIPPSIQAWQQCTGGQDFYHYQTEGSQWIYNVLRNKVRILFYSGDTDGAVPTLGTRRWIKQNNWPVVTPWRAWLVDG